MCVCVRFKGYVVLSIRFAIVFGSMPALLRVKNVWVGKSPHFFSIFSKVSTPFHILARNSSVPRVGVQVLADQGKAVAVAFDEIDKAPEEKARGITIATVRKGSDGDGNHSTAALLFEWREALPFHERVISSHSRKKGT